VWQWGFNEFVLLAVLMLQAFAALIVLLLRKSRVIGDLQVVILAALGIAAVEMGALGVVSLGTPWYALFIAVGTALGTYLALLGWLLIGDREKGLLKIMTTTFRLATGGWLRAMPVSLAASALVMCLFFAIWSFWTFEVPVRIHGAEVGSNPKFNVRIDPPGIVELRTGGELKLVAHWYDAGTTVHVSASSDDYKTLQPHQAALSRRAVFDVNVVPQKITYLGVITHGQAELPGEQFEIRLQAGGMDERLKTGNSRFEKVLPNTGQPLYVTADSSNYATRERVQVQPADAALFYVPVQPKFIAYRGIIRFGGRPLTDQQFEVRVQKGGKASDLQTSNSQFEVILPNVDEPTHISARSADYKTTGDVVVPLSSASQFFVDVVRRRNFIVEILKSDEPQWMRAGVQVIAHEKALPPRTPQQEQTDSTGFVYFETELNSIWQIAVLLDRTYTSPAITIDRDPLDLRADLADTQWTVSPRSDAGIVMRNLENVRLAQTSAASMLQTLNAGSSPVFQELPPEHRLDWLPEAVMLLRRAGYILSYQPQLKLANWVAYRIPAADGDCLQPPNEFVADPELAVAVLPTEDDFTGSGYAPGYLVSVQDMQLVSPQAVDESFYLTSVAPQVPELTQGVWLDLESYCRRVARGVGGAYVMAGPVFAANAPDQQVRFLTIGENQIPVPTHFFRILAIESQGRFDAQAFLVPNQTGLDRDISKYLTSIYEVERLTGLNFFRKVPEAPAIEERFPQGLWSF
jgi:endonuclease G, mitochondrial